MKLLSSAKTVEAFKAFYELIAKHFDEYRSYCNQNDPRNNPDFLEIGIDEDGVEYEICHATDMDISYFESDVEKFKRESIPSMLVAKYHDSNCEDKEILVAIDKAIKSSLQLRSKKELIENFIATINTSTDVTADWQRFVREQKEFDIQSLIAEEKLKPEETRKFVENAFRDGVLKTTGTDVDRIMPPVSRFGGGGSRDKKKQTVIEKLKVFFEKYFGLI